MATMTIASPTQADVGQTYAQNVGRAARALLAALLAVNSRETVQASSSQRTSWLGRDDMADFMMPNLEQELICLAGRRP